MTNENPKSRGEDGAPDPVPAKKPYQKPEFRFEKVFETMALACGKISPTQFLCRGRPRRS